MGEVFERLSQSSPWVMSTAGLWAGLDAVQAESNRLHGLRLRLLRELEARNAAGALGASSLPVHLRNRYNVAISTATRWVRSAAALDAAPAAVGDAAVAGAVNPDQLDVIVPAIAELPTEFRQPAAALLVSYCDRLDPAQLKIVQTHLVAHLAPQVHDAADAAGIARLEALDKARAAREQHQEQRRYLTLGPDRDSDLIRITGLLTPEGAEIVKAALHPLTRPLDATDPRSAGQRRAAALIDICHRTLTTGAPPDRSGGGRPHMSVTVDYDLLTREIGRATLPTGVQISPAVARRIACDAHILPIVLAGKTQVLDAGRSRRLITGPLRRALETRDRGCAFPGCDRDQSWCDGHHCRPWQTGGPTSLDNAVLLCRHHHTLMHQDQNWTAHIDTDAATTTTASDPAEHQNDTAVRRHRGQSGRGLPQSCRTGKTADHFPSAAA